MTTRRKVWIGLIVIIVTLSILWVNRVWREDTSPLDETWSENSILFDFAQPSAWDYWRIVNDGVMGGVSRSRMAQTEQGTALFSGEVSLENNGGFASVEARFDAVDLSSYDGIEITYRGDGQRYGFNMRDRPAWTVYQADFVAKSAKEGEWNVIRIPFDQLTPLSFGRRVRAEPFDPKSVITMQLIISDKQEGPFAIEVQSIKAYQAVN
jgi:NADH dehydrogenase [ubiquinone] 1 alpha subcomplex assembly factor 1